MADGVEQPPVWLAGFGCGPSVSGAAFERTVRAMKREWQAAANLALAGTRFRIAGTTWMVSRFEVQVTKR